MARRFCSFGGPPWLGSPDVFERKTLSGPRLWKKSTTPCRTPVSRDATVTTVVTPITIPSTVRKERNLWFHTVETAIWIFCEAEIFIRLFRPQRHHGV